MAGNDKTLESVVREVIGENTASKQPSPQGISNAKTGETQSGGTPVYVAGVDISDIPEQDRPRITAKLEEKAKLIEKGYQPKFQKVANLEKSLNWLTQQGITPEEATEQLQKYVEHKKNPVTGQKQEVTKTLDKLIKESPYEQKEALENMRKIIVEETDVDKLRSEVNELKKVVNYFSTKDMNVVETNFNNDLTSLREKFGKELIDKYEEPLKGEFRKFPQSKAKDILKYVVPDEEYEQALLSKPNRNQEKLNAVTNQGSGVVGSSATVNIRKTSMKDLLTSVMKDKGILK